MKFKSIVCLFWVALIPTLACKTKQHATLKEETLKVEKVKVNEAFLQTIQQVNAAKFLPASLKYSANAEYKDAKNTISLNLELAARKDQYIWFNAKAFGLVNVARVMLKPDSIRIIDLVNKKYISASYNYLNRFIKAPLSFTEMQNLVFGNGLFDPSIENSSLDTANNILVLISQIGDMRQRVTYTPELKTKSVWLNEQSNSREMSIKYGSFELFNENMVASDILINIEGEKKVECRFTLSNFATEIKQEPSFNVPKSYKVEVYN
jgi:hypothetical protein